MNALLDPCRANGDLDREVAQVRNFLARNLVGQCYLFGRPSYKLELTLHFGERKPYGSSKLQDKTRGTHVLSTRDSRWMIVSGTSPRMQVGWGLAPLGKDGERLTGKPYNTSALESGQLVRAGAKVVSADPSILDEPFATGIGLIIQLDDNTKILVIPNDVDPADVDLNDPLSDWELLTPAGVLSVGPGTQSSVVPLN